MKKTGRNINVFMRDGSLDGIIKCTTANWTGAVYKIPIKKLDSCKEIKDLKNSGVYFLMGALDENSEPAIYVGQARSRKNGEGTNQRLNEHNSKSEEVFWSEAIVLTTSNNSLGATEISYLENRFFSLAKEAHRYDVINNNEPPKGNVTEEKESELEEFIENARLVMSVLGHRVFEPIVKTTEDHDNLPCANALGDVVFLIKQEIKGDEVNARAIRTPEGIVVLSGSKLREKPVESCPPDALNNRKKYKGAIDENNVLHEDIVFDTPSSAAKFVLLRSSNGLTEWKTEDGVTLKQYERGH